MELAPREEASVTTGGEDEPAIPAAVAEPAPDPQTRERVGSVASYNIAELDCFPLGRAFLDLRFERLNFFIGKAHVLRGLTACARQGELVALMGESGSGKTSLLNVLSGRASYGEVEGSVTLNGRRHQPHKMRHLVGFVPQEYMVHRDLTVEENLEFSARLRLPSSTTAATRTALVHGVLQL